MPRGDVTIPNEAKFREVVADEVENGDGADTLVHAVGGTIATPASPGASYVQAEVVALRTAIAAILTKLTASGLID